MKTNRKRLRIFVGLAVLAVSVVAGHVNGSFPIGTLCALCPIGFAQIVAASKSVPWHLLPGVIVLLAVVFLAGRVFCSWLCPSQLLKNVFGGKRPRGVLGRSCEKAGSADDGANAHTGCTGCIETNDLRAQAVVLGVLLVASFAVGFPVFCLFCPIGLVFGTLWAINRVFVLLQPGWELLIFPLMLFIELFLFKRWCASVCPLGFIFSLIGKARAKLGFGLHPRSDCSRCLSGQGCETCSTVCPESIDVSANGTSTLEACSLCLDCMENCPTKSIALKTGDAARNASDEMASDRDAQER